MKTELTTYRVRMLSVAGLVDTNIRTFYKMLLYVVIKKPQRLTTAEAKIIPNEKNQTSWVKDNDS